MQLKSAGRSDVGRQREHNEDAFSILDDYRLFIVADGMGGHRAGDVASKLATESIVEFFETTRDGDNTWPFHFDPNLTQEENRLITSVKVANRRIYETSLRNSEVRGMGTTIVSAVFSNRRLYVAHVGDSRCYRIRNGEIELLTRDHSLRNDYLLVMPDMTEEQQEELPKNVITRALGMSDNVVVDLRPELPKPGDLYLLCSDGLSGMVTDEQILDIVDSSKDDLSAAVERLIEQANEEGGEDNVTAILVAVEELSDEDEDEVAELERQRLARATTLHDHDQDSDDDEWSETNTDVQGEVDASSSIRPEQRTSGRPKDDDD